MKCENIRNYKEMKHGKMQIYEGAGVGAGAILSPEGVDVRYKKKLVP